jgi:hypothetical protein
MTTTQATTHTKQWSKSGCGNGNGDGDNRQQRRRQRWWWRWLCQQWQGQWQHNNGGNNDSDSGNDDGGSSSSGRGSVRGSGSGSVGGSGGSGGGGSGQQSYLKEEVQGGDFLFFYLTQKNHLERFRLSPLIPRSLRKFFFISHVCTYVGSIQTGFLRVFRKSSGGTGIVIPVKKVSQEQKTQESWGFLQELPT